MAYRLRRRGIVADEIRRLVRERLDRAGKQLDYPPERREEGIHEARKRFKEIRAVLRLARAGLGDRYVVENRWYRDAARTLSEARDAQAAIETWEKLQARFPALAAALEGEALQDRLQRRLQRLSHREGRGEQARLQTLRGLPAARERVARWHFNVSGFEVIADGLERTYRQGRRCMFLACEGNGDEVVNHEWRKRVKDLWYHTRLLSPVWHEAMHVREGALKSLSDLLGDDHDLAVFEQLRRERPRLFGSKAFSAMIGERIVVRKTELHRNACDLGGLLYAEGARAYSARMSAYWHLWRGQAPGR